MSSDLHSVCSSASLQLEADSASSTTLDADNAVCSCSSSEVNQTPKSVSTADSPKDVSVTDGAVKREGQPRSSNLSSVSEEFSLNSSSPGSFARFHILCLMQFYKMVLIYRNKKY